MKGHRPPPYLRLVGEGLDIEPVDLGNRAPSTVYGTVEIAAAPLVDAGKFMIDAAMEAVIDGAADYGLLAGDTDTLRLEVGSAVTRFVNDWIVQQLTESDDVVGQ